MTTQSLILPVSFATLTRTAFAVITTLVHFGKRVVRGIQNRRQAAALAHIDSYMLADIGLTRGDIRDAAATHFWEDPTALLRARALERRLGRSGVSLGIAAAPTTGVNTQ